MLNSVSNLFISCSIILFTIIVISSSLLFLACSSLDPISALIRDCFLWVCSTSFFYEHNLYTWICIFKIFFSSYVLYFFFLFAAFYQSVDQYDDCKEIGLKDKGIEEIPILRRKFDERGVLENLK
ncbi:unnamed protein product, partial [Vitis vinifera]